MDGARGLSLGFPAGFADSRTRLQKGHFSAGQATVVHELVAHRATGPSATKERLVPIQTLLTDFAMAWFDREQHRRPVTTGFPDTHRAGV